MGEKWSKFLKDWLEQGMKTTTGIIAKIEISKNTDLFESEHQDL
jgi:hypothetical protein